MTPRCLLLELSFQVCVQLPPWPRCAGFPPGSRCLVELSCNSTHRQQGGSPTCSPANCFDRILCFESFPPAKRSNAFICLLVWGEGGHEWLVRISSQSRFSVNRIPGKDRELTFPSLPKLHWQGEQMHNVQVASAKDSSQRPRQGPSNLTWCVL